VFWVGSATVKRSLANGPPAGLPRSNKAWTATALSKQRSSSGSRRGREPGGLRRPGRRREDVEVRDLKKVWIDMGVSLVRVIDTRSWIGRG
jgi:hypothetical protein